MVVRVERTSEALGKGDGSELRVANRGRHARTRVTERGPERPEEDGEYGARHLGRLVQEGPQTLGYGQHPLSDGEVRDHLVGQVRRHLRHAPGVAGRAHPPTLAGEGQEPVMPAVRAAHTGKAVRQDAAPQVASKVALHPRRDAPAHGVGGLHLGEEGLQVMLDHRVQGRLGGAAGAIDGAGWTIRRFCGGGRPSAGGSGRGSGMGDHLPRRRKSVGWISHAPPFPEMRTKQKSGWEGPSGRSERANAPALSYAAFILKFCPAPHPRQLRTRLRPAGWAPPRQSRGRFNL